MKKLDDNICYYESGQCSPQNRVLRSAVNLYLSDARVAVSLSKHAQGFYRKRELVVRVRNHTIPFRQPCPQPRIMPVRKCTHTLLLNTPSIPSCNHSPFLCCLPIINLTARSIGARSGYSATIKPMIAQLVMTIWLSRWT